MTTKIPPQETISGRIAHQMTNSLHLKGVKISFNLSSEL